MDHQQECEFCDMVYNAAKKYNVYQFSLTPQQQFIEEMDNQLIYLFNLTSYEAISIVNKIFLLRLMQELLCDDERGHNEGTEFFEYIAELFDNLKQLIKNCVNDTEEKYDIIDLVKSNKAQYEFLFKNSSGVKRITYDLILYHIDYYIKRYCKNEL